MIFKNRAQAGKMLAEKLLKYKDDPTAIILALPRGGIEIGYEVAKDLNLPLDIIVSRKIPDPVNSELAIGAITPDGQIILDKIIIKRYKIPQSFIDLQIKKEQEEAQRRLELYRKNKDQLNLKNKIAILVDDGIATGYTMKAAIKSAKKLGAQKIVVAIPVMPKEDIGKIKKDVDELICLHKAETFLGVGAFYQNFPQLTDEEVVSTLQR